MEEGREREEEWSMKENCQFLKVNLMVPLMVSLTRFSIDIRLNETALQPNLTRV